MPPPPIQIEHTDKALKVEAVLAGTVFWLGVTLGVAADTDLAAARWLAYLGAGWWIAVRLRRWWRHG